MRVINKSVTKTRYVSTLLSSVTLIAGLWIWLCWSGAVPSFILPHPDQLYHGFLSLLEQDLLHHITTSVVRIFLGVTIATFTAASLALLIGLNDQIEAFFEWPLAAMKYVPVAALVPLSIVWVGLGDAQKVAIVSLGTFLQIVPILISAVRDVERTYLDLGRVYGLSDVQLIRRIIFPRTLPTLFDATRISFVIAWSYLIIAELCGASSGLGFLIGQWTRFAHPDRALVVVIVVASIGLSTDVAFRLSRRVLFKWADLAQGFVELD